LAQCGLRGIAAVPGGAVGGGWADRAGVLPDLRAGREPDDGVLPAARRASPGPPRPAGVVLRGGGADWGRSADPGRRARPCAGRRGRRDPRPGTRGDERILAAAGHHPGGASGWLHTGDLGRIDERGYLYVLDRAKDFIITGGSNVYAREVEDVLLRHPAVHEVAVFGVPDRLWGEAVTAAVVGADIDADDIIAF